MQGTLVGAKGGSGGSFVQKPDNLRSTDTFEGLLGLVSGPIKGPVDGLRSVRINGTPIEDVTGKTNFDNVSSIFADGDPLKFPQKPSLRLGSAGSPDVINNQLRNTTGTGDWVVHTINEVNAEAIDLRFIVNQLYKQDKKGIFNNTATIEVNMKPTGTATWINPFNGQNGGATLPAYNPGGYQTDFGLAGVMRRFLTQALYNDTAATFAAGSSTNTAGGAALTITGKTTQPFVKELRVEVPNTGTYANKSWDIRCRLVEKETVDNDPNFEKRTINWESATAVFTKVLGEHEDWRGLAWFQLYGQASDNFNGVPDVDGIYDLKIVSVPPPAVFDPTTRVYTGSVWDGSWSKAWTTDPAWCIADAISDTINGIAAFVPGAHLNKWDALELSKWCSQQVSDGKGGTHPRHSMNLLIDSPQKSDELVRYLAGSCGATAWDNGGGEWRLAVDKPAVPVDIFTFEAIEGDFNYSHSDVDTRFNDVTVVFLNEEFEYREDRIRIQNDADIAKNGRKPTKVVGIGITNRQQALRWAVLRLRTNINEFRTVSFTTNRRGKLLERFNQILIADASLNAMLTDDYIRTTGRIVEKHQNFSSGGLTLLAGTNENALSADIPQLFAGTPVRKHVRRNATADNNVGYENSALVPGRDYVSSVYVYVPSGMPVTGAYFTHDGYGGATAVANVDLSKRDQWQRLSFPVKGAADNMPSVLRMDGPEGVAIYTTALMVEEGLAPTAYTNSGSITLRDSVRLEIGVTYKVHITAPNPSYNPDTVVQPADENWQLPTITYTRNITNTAGQRGDVKELFVDVALPIGAATNANIALEAVGLPSIPRPYRILDVDYSDDGERVSINAMEIDTGKWNAADIATDENIQLVLDDAPPSPVLLPGGLVKLNEYVQDFTKGRTLSLAWGRPAAPNLKGYRVERSYNNGPWTTVVTLTLETSYELPGPSNGIHAFRVYAIDSRGRESLPLEGSYEVLEIPLNAPVGFLTNESATVAALSDGTGFNLAGTGGQFVVNYQLGNVTTGIVFSVLNETGCDVSIDPATGVYTVNSLSADQATATFRAMWQGYTIDKVYSISKSRAGANGGTGAAGLSSASVFLYQRKATAPAVPSANTTYTFASGVLSAPNNGWSQSIPAANGQPLWVTAAVASAAATTDTITPAEWAAPVVMAQDGATGASGANAAVIYLYQRKATAPAVPSVTTTYTFATSALAGINNGWSQTVPAVNGQPLWVTTATALSTGATDTVATTEWAAPTIMAQDGATGPGGPVIAIAADKQAFTFIDNTISPSGQVITLSAIRQNTAETVTWSTSPVVALGGSGLTRTLDAAAFGNNRQVTVTATGDVSGVVDKFTVVRLDLSTAEQLPVGDGNRVRYSKFERGLLGWISSAPYSTGEYLGYKYLVQTVTFDGSGPQFSAHGNDWNRPESRIPITGGERIVISYRVGSSMGHASHQWVCNAVYFDENMGTVLVNGNTETGLLAFQGGTAFGTRYSAFQVVPANARYMALRWYLISNGAAGTSSLYFMEPMVCSAGVQQTVVPPFTPGPSNEAGSDVTLYVDGPAEAVIKYSSTGVAEAGELPRNLPFSLRSASGAVASGVTWMWVISEGQVNGADASSTEYNMGVLGGGGGYAPVNSLGADNNSAIIRAYYNGTVYSKTISLKKLYLAPPSSGGSTGGGGTAGSSQSSGFATIENTTPVAISNVLSVNVTGSSLTVDVNLTVRPTLATGSPGDSWTVNLKVERETSPGSGSWVIVGTLQSKVTSITAIDSGDGILQPKAKGATFTYSPQATGLSAGNANIRVTAYLSAGAQQHTVSGTVATKVP